MSSSLPEWVTSDNLPIGDTLTVSYRDSPNEMSVVIGVEVDSDPEEDPLAGKFLTLILLGSMDNGNFIPVKHSATRVKVIRINHDAIHAITTHIDKMEEE